MRKIIVETKAAQRHRPCNASGLPPAADQLPHLRTINNHRLMVKAVTLISDLPDGNRSCQIFVLAPQRRILIQSNLCPWR